jgi:hypothetical protein
MRIAPTNKSSGHFSSNVRLLTHPSRPTLLGLVHGYKWWVAHNINLIASGQQILEEENTTNNTTDLNSKMGTRTQQPIQDVAKQTKQKRNHSNPCRNNLICDKQNKLKPNRRNNRLSRIETAPNRQEKAKQEQANVNSQIHGQEKS